MLMRKCLLAMLILMLLNLNTGYADADADLCIRIMSLCCNQKEHWKNVSFGVIINVFAAKRHINFVTESHEIYLTSEVH